MKRKITDFRFGIFDCDGVLVNSMPFYAREFAKVLNEKTGIPIKIGEKFYRETAGTIVSKQFEQILELRNKSADVSEMVELFFERINKEGKFKIFPGAKRVLKELHKAGFKLFVTSGSRHQDLEKKLAVNDLLIYFDLIMDSDVIPKGIAHMKIFAAWCELSLEEFAKRAFYLGDGPTDMRIAREAGIYAVGITNTCDAKLLLRAGADETIRHLTEILE